MIEDPVVAEIRKFRAEHTAKYGHDLNRIYAALKEVEKNTDLKVVHRQPQLLRADCHT